MTVVDHLPHVQKTLVQIDTAPAQRAQFTDSHAGGNQQTSEAEGSGKASSNSRIFSGAMAARSFPRLGIRVLRTGLLGISSAISAEFITAPNTVRKCLTVFHDSPLRSLAKRNACGASREMSRNRASPNAGYQWTRNMLSEYFWVAYFHVGCIPVARSTQSSHETSEINWGRKPLVLSESAGGVTSPLDQQILRRPVFVSSSRDDYYRLVRVIATVSGIGTSIGSPNVPPSAGKLI